MYIKRIPNRENFGKDIAKAGIGYFQYGSQKSAHQNITASILYHQWMSKFLLLSDCLETQRHYHDPKN